MTAPSSRAAIALLAAAVMLLSDRRVVTAQTNTADVGGIVKDMSGGVLHGATVTARHTATGLVVERVTDQAGRFFLPGLRAGEWEITGALPGFAPHTLKGLVLEIGRTLNVELTLGVEGLSESVTVAVNAPVLHVRPGIRRQSVGSDQRRDQGGQQRHARQPV
jgi:Carboxypeptidase regulatory-like domain